MGMRYAGFMAAAREDRLTREDREEAEGVRNEAYQRQIERDEAAHQRQIDLLDIRQKNSLRLSGIAASKAQRKKDATLRKQIDGVIMLQGLDDTPAVRAELATGIEVLGADTFLTGLKTGRIRLNTPLETVSPEASEFNMGVPVDGREADPTVSLAPETASVEASSIPEAAQSTSSPLSLPDTDAQMDAITQDTTSQLSMPMAPESPEEASEAPVELSLGSPVEETVEGDERGSSFSYGNKPYLKLADFAGQDVAALEQSIRMLEQNGYTEEELTPLKDELVFVKKAENAPEGSFADLVLEADTFGKLSALQGNLDVQRADKTIDEPTFGTRSGQITKTMNRLVEINRKNAEKDKGSLMYFRVTSTGSIGSDGMMVNVRGGKYYTPAGAEVPAEEVASGKLLPVDGWEFFITHFNKNAGKITADVTTGVTTLQSLANYRELVIKSPASLNKFVNTAGKLVGTLNSAKSALKGLVEGTYSYDSFENKTLKNAEFLNEDDIRIARAQLRAAYAMAAFSGSVGQALSDKELLANLETMGQNQSNPSKVVGVINASIKDVIQITEQRRSTAFNSMIARDEFKDTMSTTPIGTVFSDYIQNSGVLKDTSMQQVTEGYEGKTDYFSSTPSGTGAKKQISDMTFAEYLEKLKTMPHTSGGSMFDNYPEDALKKHFVSKGGKL